MGLAMPNVAYNYDMKRLDNFNILYPMPDDEAIALLAELQDREREVESGNFITIDELREEMKTWRNRK